jgi:prepilin-type N-terminal cleavage/methylation domain-containing protein
MNRRRGFTLVELLVVITIIGMLMALLLPAIQAAREQGRRTQCMNNQRNLAAALHTHEATRGSLPGYRVTLVAGKPQVSWAFMLLPQLDRQDLWKLWRSDPSKGPPTVSSAGVRLNVMFCPSDPPDTASPTDGSSAYAVNMQVCPLENGLSLANVRDGTAVTLLLSENLRASRLHNWWDIDPTKIAFADPNTSAPASPFATWFGSNHGNGVVAAFCDMHVAFIRDDVAPDLFFALATPNGSTPPVVIPSSWKKPQVPVPENVF